MQPHGCQEEVELPTSPGIWNAILVTVLKMSAHVLCRDHNDVFTLEPSFETLDIVAYAAEENRDTEENIVDNIYSLEKVLMRTHT